MLCSAVRTVLKHEGRGDPLEEEAMPPLNNDETINSIDITSIHKKLLLLIEPGAKQSDSNWLLSAS